MLISNDVKSIIVFWFPKFFQEYKLIIGNSSLSPVLTLLLYFMAIKFLNRWFCLIQHVFSCYSYLGKTLLFYFQTVTHFIRNCIQEGDSLKNWIEIVMAKLLWKISKSPLDRENCQGDMLMSSCVALEVTYFQNLLVGNNFCP